MSPADQDRTGHISASELAGFLDGELGPAERARVEAHLEGCAECRGELVEMRRITNGYAKHGSARSPRRWWIPLTIAAGLGVLVLLPLVMSRPPNGEPVRAGTTGDGEGRARIDIVAPIENATVSAGGITFTWRKAAADAYRLSLLTESGAPVWSAETADTTLALPATVPLHSDQAYFWRVEAIANGITATTGVHRVLIAP